MNGTVGYRTGVAEALGRNPKLLEQAAERVDATEKDNEVINKPTT